MKDVIVSESRIEGKGVFAARDFKKGEIVLDWRGSVILTAVQFERLPKEEKKYVYYDRDNRIMVKSPARFVNHSCDPNTFIRDFCGIANRDIKEGEEITEDYSKENNPELDILCRCGSKSCKVTVSVSSGFKPKL